MRNTISMSVDLASFIQLPNITITNKDVIRTVQSTGYMLHCLLEVVQQHIGACHATPSACILGDKADARRIDASVIIGQDMLTLLL